MAYKALLSVPCLSGLVWNPPVPNYTLACFFFQQQQLEGKQEGPSLEASLFML